MSSTKSSPESAKEPKATYKDIENDNAGLRAECGELRARLEDIEASQWCNYAIVARLVDMLRDNNLSHLLTEAYDPQTTPFVPISKEKKQEMIDDLVQLSKDHLNLVPSPTPRPSPSKPITIGPNSTIKWTGKLTEFIQVTSGGKPYLAWILDNDIQNDLLDIISHETRKKKYRYEGRDTGKDLLYHKSQYYQIDDPPGEFDDLEKNKYAALANGDLAFREDISNKINECRLLAEIPTARLARKLATMFRASKIKVPDIEQTSDWVIELKQKLLEKYLIEGDADNVGQFESGFKKVTTIALKDPQYLLDDSWETIDGTL